MKFKIVRNDISKMTVDAIVLPSNTDLGERSGGCLCDTYYNLRIGINFYVIREKFPFCNKKAGPIKRSVFYRHGLKHVFYLNSFLFMQF